MSNFGRVTVAVLDEVIARLVALRDGQFTGELNGWDLTDCAMALMGETPADGNGFSFAADWAREDFEKYHSEAA